MTGVLKLFTGPMLFRGKLKASLNSPTVKSHYLQVNIQNCSELAFGCDWTEIYYASKNIFKFSCFMRPIGHSI